MPSYTYFHPPLNQGGEKTVFRGRCEDNGLDVVVKLLNPPHTQGARDRMALEIRRLQQAAGQGVARLIDHNVHHDPPFLVEEYFPEGSLADAMARTFKDGNVYTIGQSLAWARQLLVSLHRIHEGGQIHRDIKPGNILVRGQELVITDMGIGRTVDRPSFLQTIEFRGTVGYAAPEQSNGGQVDQRADLFSVGVILQELLTGKRQTSLINFKSQSLRSYVNLLLANNPIHRFQAAAHAINAIDPLIWYPSN